MNRLTFLKRIDRKTFRALGWFLASFLLLLIFFLVNQLALWGVHTVPVTDTSSEMEANYKPWLWMNVFPLDADILEEIERDTGQEIKDPKTVDDSGWFWESPDDDEGTPFPTPTIPSSTSSPTVTNTRTSTATSTPTSTSTPTATAVPPILPTWTFTPTPINAKIVISKTLTSLASIENGEIVTFDITIVNAGAEDLGNVQVTDDLDATFGATNYSVVSVSTSGSLSLNWPGYNGSTDTNLLIGTEILQVGVSEIITLSVQINTVPGGLKTNTARAKATGVVSGKNVSRPSSDSVQVISTKILVTKTRTSSPASVPNGSTITFEIVVTNDGNDDLEYVQVKDDLDAVFGNGNYSNVSVSTTGILADNPSYNGSNRINLLLVNETLPVGGSETITLSLQIDSVSGGLKTNTADATGTGVVLSIIDTDSYDATVTVLPPDISVTKTRTSSATVANGGTVTFSIVVENTGAEDLNSVQVTDDLDAAFGAGNYSVDDVSISGSLILNWPGYNGSGLGDPNLLAGSQTLTTADPPQTITLSVQIISTLGGLKNNTAIASGTAAVSSFFVSDSDGATVTVLPPDISVTKTRTSSASVPNGSIIFYDIVVSNTGAEDLNNVQVSDNLDTPFGASNYSVVSVSTSGLLSLNWPGYNGSGDPDLLAGGQTLTTADPPQTITVSVQIFTVLGGLKNNTAIASGTAAVSSFFVSDSSNATVWVLPPGISVSKTRTSSPGSVPNGSIITYDIVVTNIGAEDLNSVQVTDDLDSPFGASNYSVVSVSTSGSLALNWPGYNGSSNTDLLAGGQTLTTADPPQTITLSVQIFTVPGGLKTNTANASATAAVSAFLVGDSNNATVTVLPPSISVTKTRTSSATVANGGTVTFSIMVDNTGAEDLNNVQVTDNLDTTFGAGTYSVVSVSISGTLTVNGAYDGSGDPYLLAGGQTLTTADPPQTITLSVLLNTVNSGTKTNTANASGTAAVSGISVSDSGFDTVTVAGSLLCTTTSLSPSYTVVGNTVSWDLTNIGGSNIYVTGIIIGWPATNSDLTQITLGGNTIWSGTDAPLWATIFLSPSGSTMVGASSTKTLTFTFASTAQATPYTILLYIDTPCVISQ